MAVSEFILLVDDEEEIRKNIANILSSNGYNVIEATNGEEALEMMINVVPDLILSDVMMPGINGFDLIKAVRENPAWIDIPIILLSALGQHQNIRNGMIGGAEDYLTKPVKKFDLLESVKSQLAQSKKRKRALEQNLYEAINQQHYVNLHELKTPTYGIFSILEYLRDDWENLPKKEVQELLNSAIISVRMLSNNILKTQYYYDYKEKDIMPARGKWTPVQSKHVYSYFLNTAQEYGREGDLQIKTYGNLTFPEDYLYRDFIFQELAENAFKFSKPGDSVVLSLQNNKMEVRNLQYQFEPGYTNLHEHTSPFAPREHQSQGLALGMFLVKKYLHSIGYHLGAKTDEQGVFVVSFEKENT